MQVTPTTSVSYTLIAYGPVNNDAVVVSRLAALPEAALRCKPASGGECRSDRTVNQQFITLDGTGSFDPMAIRSHTGGGPSATSRP